jgi:hypothetical protein
MVNVVLCSGHDFLVNEIDLEQQVVHLTSLEPPNLSTMSGVGNAEAKADNEAAAPVSDQLGIVQVDKWTNQSIVIC